MSRFGNTSTADLAIREQETRAEAYDLKTELRLRFIAEAGIEIGAVYRVADDGRALAGRLMKVEGVNAGIDGVDLRGRNLWIVFAWGRMNGKSAAGDGWTIRRQQVRISRLELQSPDIPTKTAEK